MTLTDIFVMSSLYSLDVDVGASAGLEVLDGFCCLDDMWSVDVDAGAAVEAGVRVGWSGFGSWCRCLPVGMCH